MRYKRCGLHVSTIGAGDNFNAGFVYGLIKYGITREMVKAGFSEELWDSIINCALKFSTNVCMSIDNSVDIAFGKERQRELQESLDNMTSNESLESQAI